MLQLEGEVQMQKGNVRNEEDRVKLEKERNNERVKSLESQLQRCMEETVCSSPVLSVMHRCTCPPTRAPTILCV